MRNATILVVRLKGVATEAIKNIVLAGIGKLVVADSDNVSEEDLGAGFFFRDEDVGKRVSVRRNIRLFLGPSSVLDVVDGRRCLCGSLRSAAVAAEGEPIASAMQA